MRVKMLRVKQETVDGRIVTYAKGSQWNVSQEHGDALITGDEDGAFAELDPDVEHEAAEAQRKAGIRAIAGTAPADAVEACLADLACTPEIAKELFAQFTTTAPSAAAPVAPVQAPTTDQED